MKSKSWQFLSFGKVAPLLTLTVLQQALIALGTFSLIRAGLSIENLQLFLFWVGAALLLHLLTPLFSMVLRPLETKLTYFAYGEFLKKKVLANKSKPSLWAKKDQKETYLSSISSETESYLSAIIFVILDVFSYILSLVFGVFVLGVTLDVAFVPAFAIAGALSLLAYVLMQKVVVQKSYEEQEAKTKLGGFLLQSWENILFNNSLTIQKYEDRLNQTFQKTLKASVRSTTWNEALITLLSTVSSLPVLGVILYVIVQSDLSTSAMTALLVTIPRQLNLLGTFRSLFQSMTSYISFESKFETLLKNASLQEEDLKQRISLSEIQVNGSAAGSVEKVAALESGRFTVRGRNGAGKSTYLLHLNETLESSFYLPSHPQFIHNEDVVHESTGQKIMRHLGYIQESDAKFILMDEWDANLDEKNIEIVNGVLEELSKSRVIVEVRHR